MPPAKRATAPPYRVILSDKGWKRMRPTSSTDPVLAAVAAARHDGEDVDRWLNGSSLEDAMALQRPAAKDALVIGPPVKPEKKAA